MNLKIALFLTCAWFGLDASAQNLHWCSVQQADDNKLECMDGYICEVDDSNHQDNSWACCKDHGGRSKCPSNHPNMCNSKKCGGGTAYCCEVDCAGEIEDGGFGGNRPCPCIVTDEVDELLCADGTRCFGNSTDYGSDSWKCCNERGGRLGCPPNHPNLCAAENKCGSGTSLCCEVDCADFGGDFPCVELDQNDDDDADDAVDNDDDAFDDDDDDDSDDEDDDDDDAFDDDDDNDDLDDDDDGDESSSDDSGNSVINDGSGSGTETDATTE